MLTVALDQFCFHVDNADYGYTDLYNYDEFGLPDELVAKLDSWAYSYWESMEQPANLDVETHNKVGQEIARDIKPFMTSYDRFTFSAITSIEVLPNGKKKINSASVDI